MDLSIIIVSYNAKELLAECLNSIPAAASDINFEVWVVDNGSLDGTPEMVREEWPQVQLIANQKNLGFARANNLALSLSKGDFILLLNQDMVLRPRSLVKTVEYMRANPAVGAAGGHLTNERGETMPSVRRFPTFWDQAAIALKLPHLVPRLLDKYLMNDFDYSKEAEVDSIRGSFFMINWQALERVGLLDERFFFWFEEVDYCRRLKETGWQVQYLPIDVAMDYFGKSVKKLPFWPRQRMFLASLIKYFWKWGL